MDQIDTICPRCELEMSDLSFANQTTICEHCGWTPDIESELALPTTRKQIMMRILLFGFLIFSGYHFLNWENNSLSIISPKIKAFLGFANATDYQKIAEICESMHKFECLENARAAKAEISGDITDVLQSANLHRLRENHVEAIAKYQYLLKRESDLGESADLKTEIYTGLARSNEAIGRNEDAFRYYELAIQQKPNVIQVTVTKDYVTLLRKNGQNDRAEKVIKEARKRSRRDDLFANI